MTTPVRIAITGAAGQIGYSLLFRIASGAMLGPDTPVILQLLEVTPALGALEGVKMELEDCAFPLLQQVVCTDSGDVAFGDGAKFVGRHDVFDVGGEALLVDRERRRVHFATRGHAKLVQLHHGAIGVQRRAAQRGHRPAAARLRRIALYATTRHRTAATPPYSATLPTSGHCARPAMTATSKAKR